MKNVLISLSIIIAFIFLAIYLLTDESYKLAKKAEEMLKAGDVEQAEKLTSKALEINRYNRKAILVDTKIKRYIKNKEIIRKAKIKYEEALDNLEKGNFKDAQVKLIEAIDLLNKINDKDLLYEEANKLMDKIVEEIQNLTDRLGEYYYNNALKAYKEGDLIGAYELLELIEVKDKKILDLKSKIAFEIGEKRYNKILESDFQVSEYELKDALYWFRNVDRYSNYYDKSREYIKTLNEHIK
ncbi:MAG: hypothetical protein SVN78_08620 [Deferribacterota bacterium]|nr:hypothetical protein [Deferribacterota bacterium]